MKTVSVHFNTTKHVKSFLINNYGDKPMFDSTNPFHDFLLLCLAHTNMWHEHLTKEYSLDTKLYISKADYERYGCHLNKLQNKFLHLSIDRTMKQMLVCYTDSYLNLHSTKVLNKALEYSLEMMKLSEDDWEIDSIKRYYHRYRTRNGRDLLYNKEKPLVNMSDKKNNSLNMNISKLNNLEGTLFNELN